MQSSVMNPPHPYATDRALARWGLLAAVCACVIQWRRPEAEWLPLAPVALLGAPLLWRVFRKLTDAQLLAGVVFLQLVAEEDVAFSHMPSIFKPLGELVFSAKAMLGVGLNIKGQEVLYVGLAAWIVFRNRRRDILRFLLDPRFRVAALLALAIPAAAVFALVVGQVKGNNLGLAITQIHFLVLAPFALYAGYAACRSEADFLRVMRAVVAAMIIKSVLAWYAFYVYLGQDLHGREYLIEHWTSDYLATAMIALSAGWLVGKKTVTNTLVTLFLVALIFWPFVLNDRRTAFVGLAFAVALLPCAFWNRVRLWHFGVLAAVAVAFVLFLAATWDMPRPLGFFADLIEGILWPPPSALGGIYKYDYRQLENYNLYVGVARDPFFGMGLGSRFPHAIPMADIAMNFELWDALPHNNMLFTWCFLGPLGMGALGTFTAVGAAVGIRLVRKARSGAEIMIGVLAFTGIVRWIFWVFGDLGLVEIPLFCLISVTIGMALKLDQEAL